MKKFTPHTGAVIDHMRRPEPLTDNEQQFADWAQDRGLLVMFSKEFPEEGDPYMIYELGIEEFIDGQVYAQFYTVLNGGDGVPYKELWPLWEQGLRAAFERAKTQQGASLPDV